ncbi:BQ5605_C038g11706 [Microbotryum silenes-dioicae]|uniref:BQ5605_C038g11706 protein n=1 Tax=Microbotryum silenes-dioicae TaxID=796604 RepID=A0A2X0MF50_9BASI|nr:BQ5605_C038g11706 [Microbotryum silenes-dioicae]
MTVHYTREFARELGANDADVRDPCRIIVVQQAARPSTGSASAQVGSSGQLQSHSSARGVESDAAAGPQPGKPTTLNSSAASSSSSSSFTNKTPRFVSRHCHQDKKTPVTQPRMFCSNTDCSFNYCDKCIRKHYTSIPFVANALFECPACQGICSCARCVKARIRNKKVRSAPGGKRLQHHSLGGAHHEDHGDEESDAATSGDEASAQSTLRKRKSAKGSSATQGHGPLPNGSEQDPGSQFGAHVEASGASAARQSRTRRRDSVGASDDEDDDDAESDVPANMYNAAFGHFPAYPMPESSPSASEMMLPQLVLGTGEVVDPNVAPFHGARVQATPAEYDGFSFAAFSIESNGVKPCPPTLPRPTSSFWQMEAPERKRRRMSTGSAGSSAPSVSSLSSFPDSGSRSGTGTGSMDSYTSVDSTCSSPEATTTVCEAEATTPPVFPDEDKADMDDDLDSLLFSQGTFSSVTGLGGLSSTLTTYPTIDGASPMRLAIPTADEVTNSISHDSFAPPKLGSLNDWGTLASSSSNLMPIHHRIPSSSLASTLLSTSTDSFAEAPDAQTSASSVISWCDELELDFGPMTSDARRPSCSFSGPYLPPHHHHFSTREDDEFSWATNGVTSSIDHGAFVQVDDWIN